MDDHAPEPNLWRAVLIQALIDATIPTPTRLKSGREMAEQTKKAMEYRGKDRTEARQWLTGGKDFAMVCEFAQYDPKEVSKSIDRLASQGWPRIKGTFAGLIEHDRLHMLPGRQLPDRMQLRGRKPSAKDHPRDSHGSI